MTVPGWGHRPVTVVHASSGVLEPDSAGSTRELTLGPTGAGVVGLWEIDAGTAHDVEVDEVFVVVSGWAANPVEGWPDVVVGPGGMVRLRSGTATTWVVTERLRKVYLSW